MNCPIIEEYRKYASRVFQIDETDLSTQQLHSPRLNFMFDIEPLLFKNAKVLYISTNKEMYQNIYDLVYACRVNATCASLFYLGEIPESFDDLLGKTEKYNVVSGETIPLTTNLESGRIQRHLLLQAYHILYEWTKRGFLKTKRTSFVSSGGIVVERDSSCGEHIALDKTEGWLFNTSTPIVAMLIDYYQVESSFGGINSQLNFTGDAEYRLKVARILLDILKSFRLNNPDHELSSLGLAQCL